MLNDLKKIN